MDQKSSRPETQPYSGPGTGSSNPKPNSVSDSMSRGKEAIGHAANSAARSTGSDLRAIQNDLNSLKDTLSRFMSQAGTDAVKSPAMPRQTLPGKWVTSQAISPTGAVNSLLPPGTKRRPSLRSWKSWLVEIRLAR
jgi:hypothetical protein